MRPIMRDRDEHWAMSLFLREAAIGPQTIMMQALLRDTKPPMPSMRTGGGEGERAAGLRAGRRGDAAGVTVTGTCPVA